MDSKAKLDSAAKSLQSCPTLCDPMDCSQPGFFVHGILQARTLEWVAISFSKLDSSCVKSSGHIRIYLWFFLGGSSIRSWEIKGEKSNFYIIYQFKIIIV